ncbi:MAG TPA: hypothetical protein VGM44_19685, partial [Polyangiaceae bacterium]
MSFSDRARLERPLTHMIRVAHALGLTLTLSLLSACGASDDSALGSRGGSGSSTPSAGSSGSATTNGGSAGAVSNGGTSSGGTNAGGASNAGAANGGSAGNSSADNGGAGGSGGASGGAGASGSAGSTSSGDIVGKVTVGYQGWFNAAGDGSGINPPWWHWTPDRNTPTTTNVAIKSWPDVSELSKTYATGFANLGNGGTAKLYSDWDASTVDTQIKWMQDTGIDTIALQRFG